MADALAAKVAAVLKSLRAHASAKVRREMASRYAIVVDKAAASIPPPWPA